MLKRSVSKERVDCLQKGMKEDSSIVSKQK